MRAESSEVASGVSRWLDRLGSLKLTALILALLLAGTVTGLWQRQNMTWLLLLPLALFALNLCAAMLTHPTFRRQTALLVFHLALLALVLLFAAARLTYFKGQIELAEGTVFDGQMVMMETGPLHRNRLAQAGFVNLGFSSEFAQGGARRVSTRNHVRWMDEQGRQHDALISDLEPLTLQGYRIYTDTNMMGFALAFAWLPEKGRPDRGMVLLPSYQQFRDKQQQEWTPPGGGIPLTLTLQSDEVILEAARPSQFRLPKEHSLLVRIGDQQHTLAPGARLEVAGGTLVYEGLRRWLGYSVNYDWSVPWILAAAVLAVLALAGHFWSKFAAQPWLKEEKEA